jgi:hypothetical protein
MAVVANFDKNQNGVGMIGAKSVATGNVFMPIPTDGIIRSDMPDKPYDYYMAPDGTPMDRDKASEELKAMQPTASDTLPAFPEMPTGTEDPEKDPMFMFPE